MDRKKTVAFNDDGPDNFCASISYTNTGFSQQEYTLIIASYWSGVINDIEYFERFGGGGWNEQISLGSAKVGGVVARFNHNATGEIVEVLPVPGKRGGHRMDSILFVIDPTIGGKAIVNDDSGMEYLSRINNFDCRNKECWIIAGGYNDGAGNEGNIAFWSHKKSSGDSDGDGISNIMEDILALKGRLFGDAKTQKDGDGDGLTDYVELLGVNASSLSGGDASLCLPWEGDNGGADPMKEDLFIEIDWMERAGHSHKPDASFASRLTDVFSDDKVYTKRDITTHLFVSNPIEERDFITFGSCTGSDTIKFSTIKLNVNNFNPLKRLVYHYAIFAHGLKVKDNCTQTANGEAENGGNDFITAIGDDNNVWQMNTSVHNHELGHNLGLDHNFNDVLDGARSATEKDSCVHSSVMNYRYGAVGFPGSETPEFPHRRYGYSTGHCSARTSPGCNNTCNTSGCVTENEITPKAHPEAGCKPVYNPNGTILHFLSDGKCDCDREEWGKFKNTSVNKVQLGFQGSVWAQSFVLGGNNAEQAADEEALSEYVGGVAPGKYTKRHEKFSKQKEAYLNARGWKVGVNMWKNRENGKFYVQ